MMVNVDFFEKLCDYLFIFIITDVWKVCRVRTCMIAARYARFRNNNIKELF